MSGRMRKTEREARRKRVLALYLRHVTQSEIASLLNVNQSTISRDIEVIEAEWRKERDRDLSEWKARMLADLESIERDASTRYTVTNEPEWLRLRLLVQERRAKLLGTDAPKKLELDSPTALRVTFVDDWRTRSADEPAPATPPPSLPAAE